MFFEREELNSSEPNKVARIVSLVLIRDNPQLDVNNKMSYNFNRQFLIKLVQPQESSPESS